MAHADTTRDGLWTVSVADAPYDVQSYTIYIKSPTHHLTLTRLAAEIVQLDTKLRASHPGVSIPPLPPIPTSFMPRKRKSTFLRALGKLSRKRGGGLGSAAPSPLPTPSTEHIDPFLSMSASIHPTNVTTATTIAAYLTTVSNIPALRHTTIWRRFMRVRTEDLQSTRAERPLKRVRPDLLAVAHMDVPSGDQEATDSESAANASATPVKEECTGVEATTEPLRDRPTRVFRSHSASAGVSRGFTASLVTHPHAQPREDQKDASTLVSSSAIASSRTEASDPSSSDSSLAPPSLLASDVKRKTRPQSLQKPVEIQVEDFEMMRVLGKGCAGKVLLVKKKNNTKLYALKAIMKRHVLAHQELMHTLTEQAVLKRLGRLNSDEGHPFIVKLWWSFHDKENLFLVLDFHPGGDLATQLSRWGRLGRDRARFYAAEIVEGVEGLHREGIVYRDLKPENILIAANGHVVLTDFGLCKEFTEDDVRSSTTTAPSTPKGTRRWESVGSGLPMPADYLWNSDHGTLKRDETKTFCGTAEYLAPEVIQGLPYSYEVDWWALGTLLYEMLVGITPFWAQSQADMYRRVLEDELKFPESKSLDPDTRSFLRGLLHRNPHFRLCEPRLKKHAYFSMIDWSHVYHKRYIPPYIPPTDPSNASDTQNFDNMFLSMDPVLDSASEGDAEASNDSSSMQSQTSPRGLGSQPSHMDLFHGYSYRGEETEMTSNDERSDERSLSVYSQSGDGQSDCHTEDADISLSSRATAPVHTEEPSITETITPGDTADLSQGQTTDVQLDISTPTPKFTSTPRDEQTSSPSTPKRPSLDEADEAEDDWDLVECGGTDRNGGASTLFARGVVDRYRLAFKKDKGTDSVSHSRRTSRASELSDSLAPVSPTKTSNGRPLFRRDSSGKPPFLHLRLGSKIGDGKDGGKIKKPRPASMDMGRLSLDAHALRAAPKSPLSPSMVTSPTLSNASGTTAETLEEEEESKPEDAEVEVASDSSDSTPGRERNKLKKGAGKVFLMFSPSHRT